MLQAELCNKLVNPHKNMHLSEDLLTSNVFGILKYLDNKRVLIDFIRSAINQEGKTIKNITGIVDWRYYFWPKFQNQIEPDLLIQGFRKKKLVVNLLVEAKYRSNKNIYQQRGSLTGDQLADELNSLLEREWSSPEIDKSRIKENYLVFITNHFNIPLPDIVESNKLVKRYHQKQHRIYWTSWRNLPSIIDDNAKQYTKGQQEMLQDLKNLLNKKRINRTTLTYLPDTTPIGSNDNLQFFVSKQKKPTLTWNIDYENVDKFLMKGRHSDG